MGYDSLSLGELELRAPDLLADSAPYRTYALVSANVKYPDGEGPAIVPYIIKDAAGIKVAVTGVVARELASAAFQASGSPLPMVEDEEEALLRLIPELRTKAQLVVVVAHTGLRRAQDLGNRVPGIDAIISGHEGTMAAEPIKTGKIHAVQAGGDGEYVGELVLKVDPDGKIFQVEGRAIALTKDMPENAEVKALIESHPTASASSVPGGNPGAQPEQ